MTKHKGEIIAKVLEFCLTESSKTNVVYGNGLNFRTVDLYLDYLITYGSLARVTLW